MVKRVDWRSPLNIPPGKIGNFEVKVEKMPPGTPMLMNNFRNAFIGRQEAPRHVAFKEATAWHKLQENGATWMSDYPIEQRQHDEVLKHLRGSVLVGGLGLGYAVTYLAARKQVGKITVVELNQEVIDLVFPYLETKGKVEAVRADLLEFLKQQQGKKRRVWTQAFYDIWASDGEGTFFNTVVPLHQLSKTCVKKRPICWNENVMRGQLQMSLQNKLMYLQHPEILPPGRDNLPPLWEYDGTEAPWHNWQVPFWQWFKEASPNPQLTQYAMEYYASSYGLAGWENLWKGVASRWNQAEK